MPSGRMVDLDLIDEDPNNPRGDVGDVSDLKLSLALRGQEEDLHLIPKPDGRFWLHEGHRRIKAMRELGWHQASHVERHFATDRERRLSQGVLHVHRRDWNPMAWARYCHDLYWTHKLGRNAIARSLQVSPNWVRDTISLMTLDRSEQRELEDGLMSKAEALRRIAGRRARREWESRGGQGAPPAGDTPRPRQARSKDQAYFNIEHPLAQKVARRCKHAAAPKISTIGCGACWEAEIRADALANVTPLNTANLRHGAADFKTAGVA